MTLTKVAKVSEVPPGTGKVVDVEGTAVAVFNCEGRFYAMANTCTHRGGPLGEGSLAGTTVTCPWHGWQYDVTSGACHTNPAGAVKTFDVKVEGDELFVYLS